MKPVFSTGLLCLLILALGASVGSRIAAEGKAELDEGAVAAEEMAFLSPDGTRKVTVRPAPCTDERRNRCFTFTLEPLEGSARKEETVLEYRTSGGPHPLPIIQWSPGSRYLVLMHENGRTGRSAAVYDCRGDKAVKVPLPLDSIRKEVSDKLDKHVKQKDSGNPPPDQNWYAEGVQWTSDGRLMATVKGFSLSPEEIGFSGQYEVGSEHGGPPLCVAWEVHDLEKK